MADRPPDDADAKPNRDAKADLEAELDRLQARMPPRITKVMTRVRSPSAKPYRIPIGVALAVGGVFGFLPVVGFWMLPLGLAVMAQDVPAMRPPMAKLLRKINGKRNRELH